MATDDRPPVAPHYRDFHLFAGACVQCHKLVQFTAPAAEYKAWVTGFGLIQNAMPSLSEEDREFLISGVCGKCFDELFAEDAEEVEL